ncbi:MAG: DNA topoisomerase III [Betaproteobacteria bacterium]|nr:DNA topoisomerase III [Betaproteobacteria bacterium]
MPNTKRADAPSTPRKSPSRKSTDKSDSAVLDEASKRLIITEKPSVAADVARALGGFTRHGDYFESDQFVVCSAIGHLLELAAPEEYEVKRGKWSFTHLPVIPPHFDLRPIEKTQERLKLLKRLIKRKDVSGLINACDAGREGELIFRYIVQDSGTRKAIERLWLQSMTPAAIREGFTALRADTVMLPLADAAACRSESDWLIGINGTRAMTAFNSKDGGFYKTTVGRVQTPTLAILVEREERIKRFKSRDYWEVTATFSSGGGEYAGKWFDEDFAKTRKADDPDLRADRIWKEEVARAIVERCTGRTGVVTEESKPTTQISPMLYDLTSLQREANGRFGFSAKMTLGIAQALYEKHKVLTYPRTDSRALPEDYLATVKTTLEGLTTASDGPRGRDSSVAAFVDGYAPFAARILKEGWIRPNKRIFNNEKISDHFAIIPTLEKPKSLSEPEQKLYDMVMKRFLAVFYPSAEYLVTTRITRIGDDPFKTEGRVLVNSGWLEVYGKEARSDDDSLLAPVENARAEAVDVVSKEIQTKPPARFNEGTLLSAMEGAGKLVEDEELRAAMTEKGLGTPATRAAIIEGLIQEEYVVRDGRDLTPTAKAFDLLYALNKFGIDELRSPELTGTWEYNLKQIEQGRLKRAEFMKHIVQMTQDLVDRVKQGTLSDEPISTLQTPCPKCGGKLVENYKKFACTACDFAMWKVIAGRRMEAAEIETLIRERSIGPVQGFRSKMGRPFAAMLRLKDDFTAEFDFGQGGSDGSSEQEPVDFSGQEPLGPCPKCGANIYDHGMAYVCERSVGPERSCDFRSGKIILQRQIEPEQMRKLLSTGKTDLLHRFISKKGRPFSAYLVRGTDGKVVFEFAPRGKAASAEEKANGKTPARRKGASSR